MPSDGDRSSYTWGPLLLILQEDQHLDIYGGVGDAAKPYPGAFKAVLERDDRFQEDVFHQLRDLQTLRRKLENSAYCAFATEYKAAKQCQKEDTAEAQEKLRQAQAESLRRAGLHDDFAEYCSWVADAFEIVDLRSGEIRDREINEWLLNEAIAGMSQLDRPEVVKMSERLDQYQIQDFQAISRHIALVAVVYSLLRAAPHDEILLHKLQRQLRFDLDGSAPFWRRATEAQSLWCLACFISIGLTQGQSLHQLMAPLLAAVCY